MTLSTVPRYTPERVQTVGDRAIVLGASMAGMLTGRVLADAFEEVLILERDEIEPGPTPRRGVPQGHHSHIMLEACRATVEDCFPGYGEDLIAEGGLMIDAVTDVVHYERGGFLAPGATNAPMYCASRPLFEYLVRERIRNHDGVDLRGGCQFTDFITDDAASTVSGVHIRNAENDEATIPADLVVDATGRTSRTPTWLEEHGYRPPPVSEVEVDVAYSTALIDRPPSDRRAFTVPPDDPRTHGCITIPIEDDRWTATAFGVHGDHPPTEKEAFKAFVDDLPIEELAELIATQSWASDDIAQYPFPSNRRRRFEDLDRFPNGLLAIGDAICSFNPIYGQGMSVACLEARILHDMLASDVEDTADVVSLPQPFFERTGAVIDVPWLVAVGSDFQFPQTTGPKPAGADLFNRYIDRLVQKAHTDGTLRDAFYDVILMEKSHRSLLHPRVVSRVLSPI